MSNLNALQCIQCNCDLLPDAISCASCGAFDSRQALICSDCGDPYPLNFVYCVQDGAALVVPDISKSGTKGTVPLLHVPDNAAATSEDFTAKVMAFWNRHLVLCCLTLAMIGAWGAYVATGAGGWATLGLALGIPLALSWPVGLAGSSNALGFVGWIDRWYFRLSDFFENWDSKLSWFMYPVVWAGGRWAVFASRNGDRFVAASLRMFGYALTIMLLAFVALVAVYIIVFLVLFALTIWALAAFFGVDNDVRPSRRKPMVGRRGERIYEGDGGWFSTDKAVGRVDKDGNVYEGGDGWFDVEKRVGKIGKDGQIYEGDGGWFSTDKRVGKIGPDGEVYEGDGGWFSTDKRIGKIGPDGEVYEGDGGWFSTDKRVGKSKRDS